MEPPIPLTGQALGFWTRHADRLADAGILSDRSLDSFVLLCQTWSMVQTLASFEPGSTNFREMVQFNQANKNYQALAKQFGLLPRDARASKMEPTSAAKPTDNEFL
jgi:phage terminase small subunit